MIWVENLFVAFFFCFGCVFFSPSLSSLYLYSFWCGFCDDIFYSFPTLYALFVNKNLPLELNIEQKWKKNPNKKLPLAYLLMLPSENSVPKWIKLMLTSFSLLFFFGLSSETFDLISKKYFFFCSFFCFSYEWNYHFIQTIITEWKYEMKKNWKKKNINSSPLYNWVNHWLNSVGDLWKVASTLRDVFVTPPIYDRSITGYYLCGRLHSMRQNVFHRLLTLCRNNNNNKNMKIA